MPPNDEEKKYNPLTDESSSPLPFTYKPANPIIGDYSTDEDGWVNLKNKQGRVQKFGSTKIAEEWTIGESKKGRSWTGASLADFQKTTPAYKIAKNNPGKLWLVNGMDTLLLGQGGNIANALRPEGSADMNKILAWNNVLNPNWSMTSKFTGYGLMTAATMGSGSLLAKGATAIAGKLGLVAGSSVAAARVAALAASIKDSSALIRLTAAAAKSVAYGMPSNIGMAAKETEDYVRATGDNKKRWEKFRHEVLVNGTIDLAIPVLGAAFKGTTSLIYKNLSKEGGVLEKFMPNKTGNLVNAETSLAAKEAENAGELVKTIEHHSGLISDAKTLSDQSKAYKSSVKEISGKIIDRKAHKSYLEATSQLKDDVNKLNKLETKYANRIKSIDIHAANVHSKGGKTRIDRFSKSYESLDPLRREVANQEKKVGSQRAVASHAKRTLDEANAVLVSNEMKVMEDIGQEIFEKNLSNLDISNLKNVNQVNESIGKAVNDLASSGHKYRPAEIIAGLSNYWTKVSGNIAELLESAPNAFKYFQQSEILRAVNAPFKGAKKGVINYRGGTAEFFSNAIQGEVKYATLVDNAGKLVQTSSARLGQVSEEAFEAGLQIFSDIGRSSNPEMLLANLTTVAGRKKAVAEFVAIHGGDVNKIAKSMEFTQSSIEWMGRKISKEIAISKAINETIGQVGAANEKKLAAFTDEGLKAYNEKFGNSMTEAIADTISIAIKKKTMKAAKVAEGTKKALGMSAEQIEGRAVKAAKVAEQEAIKAEKVKVKEQAKDIYEGGAKAEAPESNTFKHEGMISKSTASYITKIGMRHYLMSKLGVPFLPATIIALFGSKLGYKFLGNMVPSLQKGAYAMSKIHINGDLAKFGTKNVFHDMTDDDYRNVTHEFKTAPIDLIMQNFNEKASLYVEPDMLSDMKAHYTNIAIHIKKVVEQLEPTNGDLKVLELTRVKVPLKKRRKLMDTLNTIVNPKSFAIAMMEGTLKPHIVDTFKTVYADEYEAIMDLVAVETIANRESGTYVSRYDKKKLDTLKGKSMIDKQRITKYQEMHKEAKNEEGVKAKVTNITLPVVEQNRTGLEGLFGK